MRPSWYVVNENVAETTAHSFLIFGIASRPSTLRVSGVCSRKYTTPPPTKTGANKRELPPLFARLLDGPTSRHFNNAAIAKFTIILLRRHLHAPHKSSPILSSFVPSPPDLLFVGRPKHRGVIYTGIDISRNYIITELSMLYGMYEKHVKELQ